MTVRIKVWLEHTFIFLGDFICAKRKSQLNKIKVQIKILTHKDS